MYAYCHDSVLMYLLTSLTKTKKNGIQLHFDLERLKSGGGSTAPSVIVSDQHPDLAIFDDRKHQRWFNLLNSQYILTLEIV